MITGMHVIIYSHDTEKDRIFFRDVLRFPHVDAGDGWLIFAAPPAEIACHPTEGAPKHEAYLMCDDLSAQIGLLQEAGYPCDPPIDQGWGVLTGFVLPGGSRLGLYEPRHPRPSNA